MRLEYQIIAALLLDLALGDPRRLPHPVRLIGRFALALEGPLRRRMRSPRLAGMAAALLVVGAAAGATAAAILAARLLHPGAGAALSILFLYWSFAARDLADHARNVSRALGRDDLAGARRLVSLMVGRDTADMDKPEIARAAVESVAENTVDGVVAPLFFAIMAGPVGAMAYKAASTLDSTFGYQNERYREFGWASAKFDDLANYLPARLTVPLVMLAALPRGGAARALSVARREGRRHLSPNAGLAEASMAGALGIQLGGPLRRNGLRQEAPLLGAPAEAPGIRHIGLAVGLMYRTTALAAVVFLAARFGMAALLR